MIESSSTVDVYVDLYCRNRPCKTNTLLEKIKALVFDQLMIKYNDNLDKFEQCLFFAITPVIVDLIVVI